MVDTALLSGGVNPTGTIDFFLNGTLTPGCAVAVGGNGDYTCSYFPGAAGEYTWLAVYSGDLNNRGVTSLAGLQMVDPAATSITTTPGGSVSLGSGVRLTDSAVLTHGVNPGGTLTFVLTGPGGSEVDIETVSVHGDGTYETSIGYLPSVVGTYEWKASYSGDSNNSPVTSNFGDEPQKVTPAVPEPATIALLGSSVAALLLRKLNKVGAVS